MITCRGCFYILGVSEQLGVNERSIKGVGTGQADAAGGLRVQYRCRQQRPCSVAILIVPGHLHHGPTCVAISYFDSQ